jgi:hypothetical protein
MLCQVLVLFWVIQEQMQCKLIQKWRLAALIHVRPA